MIQTLPLPKHHQIPTPQKNTRRKHQQQRHQGATRKRSAPENNNARKQQQHQNTSTALDRASAEKQGGSVSTMMLDTQNLGKKMEGAVLNFLNLFRLQCLKDKTSTRKRGTVPIFFPACIAITKEELQRNCSMIAKKNIGFVPKFY